MRSSLFFRFRADGGALPFTKIFVGEYDHEEVTILLLHSYYQNAAIRAAGALVGV